MHKRCSDIRVKLKEDSRLKCQTYANQQTDIAEDYPGIELNSQSFEIFEKFCCFRDTIGARGDRFDKIKTKIRNG